MSQEFTLTEDHVELLSAFNICWTDCEYGSPGVDCKRPFGNSGESQIISNMEEILGKDKAKCCPECGYREEAELDEMRCLYRELETALEVVLTSTSFTAGTYVTDDKYGRKVWRLKE